MSDIDKFSGDMSRNEVEIDLKKFMAMGIRDWRT